MNQHAPISRRRVLALIGATSATLLAACGRKSTTSATVAPTDTASSPDPTDTTTGNAVCATIPEETTGPFPGDGSNGPDIRTVDGVVRRDIRTSIGDASGTADGVPLTFSLRLKDSANGCAPLTGAAVYAWHCNRTGDYSMYSSAAASENYLRGIQEADAEGVVTFDTIFPGCYAGRWPHIHFEVYASLADATGTASPVATSQLAFPVEACETAYAHTGYEASTTNLGGLSLAGDMVFADGADLQTVTVTGDATRGFTAVLDVTV